MTIDFKDLLTYFLPLTLVKNAMGKIQVKKIFENL